MKVRIGYTNQYIEIEDVSQLNNLDVLFEDIKKNELSCSFCKEKIKGDDWKLVIHNPKEKETPIRIHFFHHSKECAKKWGEIGIKDRVKLVTGDF